MSVLDGFTVYEVPRTFSIAEVRILKNKITFNIAAASELGYPGYVRVWFSHDKTQIALEPCEKTDTNALPFFAKIKPDKRNTKTISVGNRALATLIKIYMKWDMEKVYIAPGVRDEGYLIFDLLQAYQRGTKPKGESGLCVIPYPAYPFAQIPAKYFSTSQIE